MRARERATPPDDKFGANGNWRRWAPVINVRLRNRGAVRVLAISKINQIYVLVKVRLGDISRDEKYDWPGTSYSPYRLFHIQGASRFQVEYALHVKLLAYLWLIDDGDAIEFENLL